MDPPLIARLIPDLLLILTVGFISGALCKRFGISMLVGYLVVGALIGDGGLGFVSQGYDVGHHDLRAGNDAGASAALEHELEFLAHGGALLLLFAIGIEFSLAELARMGRYLVVGGCVQMVLVAVPVALVCRLFDTDWGPAILIGSAAALSSTVLVFKALEECGLSTASYGRRAVGILLFQDAALVPLLLFVPLLAGFDSAPGLSEWGLLAVKSFVFVVAVMALRGVTAEWMIPLLAGLRSAELMVLFTLTVLGSVCLATYAIGLPPALGALAAGLIMSGNRLSSQIDALVLPYRETFAAVFFVSLGTLMRPSVLFEAPLVVLAGLAALLVLKTGAAAVALRATGLGWRPSLGMGMGLAQLGELSFMLLSVGMYHGVISCEAYNRTLFIALGTLILTPRLLRTGLRWVTEELAAEQEPGHQVDTSAGPIEQAVVVGLGPIGKRVTSQLEISGVDVCLIDLSPVNLHPFAQQGFRTISGDARDPETLHNAGVPRCRLAVVTVPDDPVAVQVVAAIHKANPACRILVRCRYQLNTAAVRKAGADAVVSEETEATTAILRLLEGLEGERTPPAN